MSNNTNTGSHWAKVSCDGEIVRLSQAVRQPKGRRWGLLPGGTELKLGDQARINARGVVEEARRWLDRAEAD